MKLFYHPKSGHSHKVRLLLSILNINAELVIVDLKAGEQHKPQFKKLNCFAQVPVLIDVDLVISDSNAILVYLASQYGKQWLPDSPKEMAEVQKFLSLSSGPMAFGVAAARAHLVMGKKLDYSQALQTSITMFNQLEECLEQKEWLVGKKPSIADLSLYTYTKLAPEGGINIDIYQNINRWLASVERLPGFIPM